METAAALPDDDEGDADDRPITIEDLEDLMGELRGIASNLLQCESDADSIRPTALIISGLRRYKVSDQDWDEISWANRSHFFKSAYMMMRRALIDHARRRRAEKRPRIIPTEDDALDFANLVHTAEHTPDVMIALDEALSWLGAENEELRIIVEHHYFSGLTVNEIARIIGMSEKTVKRRLDKARLFLGKKISELLREG